MDPRNVRIMKPYADGSCANGTVYIDELARDALHLAWGEEILVVGRRRHPAKIAPIREEDGEAQAIRMNQDMLDKVYCCVGDEVLLYLLE